MLTVGILAHEQLNKKDNNLRLIAVIVLYFVISENKKNSTPTTLQQSPKGESFSEWHTAKFPYFVCKNKTKKIRFPHKNRKDTNKMFLFLDSPVRIAEKKF